MNVSGAQTLMRDDRTSDAIERFEQKGRSADSLRLRENKGFDEARPLNASPTFLLQSRVHRTE